MCIAPFHHCLRWTNSSRASAENLCSSNSRPWCTIASRATVGLLGSEKNGVKPVKPLKIYPNIPSIDMLWYVDWLGNMIDWRNFEVDCDWIWVLKKIISPHGYIRVYFIVVYEHSKNWRKSDSMSIRIQHPTIFFWVTNQTFKSKFHQCVHLRDVSTIFETESTLLTSNFCC